MLLSRHAEALYWAGRYLERAEATARMVAVHTELMLDLPRAAGVGWHPLLAVAGHGEDVLGLDVPTEEDVVGFLTADPANPGSVVASIARARANLRVVRVLLPDPCWEIANDLHARVGAAAALAADRRTRAGWIDQVAGGCQRLTGSLAGTMCDDDAYAFLLLGRYLERADMTTRVLDVQAGVLVGGGGNAAYGDVTWMSVLKSLSAHQMFRRSVGAGMSGPAALRFLLQDPRFPRSVEYCLSSAARALPQLPQAATPLAACATVRRLLLALEIDEDISPSALHALVDELQLGIGVLHDALAATWFRVVEPTPVVDREPEPAAVPAGGPAARAS
ncbi:MAG: alpha-E domain-containing protein [Pseudonocardia sp.]